MIVCEPIQLEYNEPCEKGNGNNNRLYIINYKMVKYDEIITINVSKYLSLYHCNNYF